MRTVLMNLPFHIKGFVTEFEGETIIFLNSRLTREANTNTFLHELEHINHHDLDNDIQVDLIEYLRHEKGA